LIRVWLHLSSIWKKAEEYFKKAFDGQLWEEGFKLILSYNIPNTSRKTAAEILEYNIESINPKFQVEVRGLEWSNVLATRRTERLPAFIIGWLADYADPHNFVHPYLHSHGDFMYFTGDAGRALAAAEFDSLIEAAVKTTNQAERQAIYSEIQQKASDLAVHIWYCEPTGVRVMGDYVKGWTYHPMRPAQYDFYQLSK